MKLNEKICDTLPARGARSEWGEIESMKWSVQKFADLFSQHIAMCIYTLMIGRIL